MKNLGGNLIFVHLGVTLIPFSWYFFSCDQQVSLSVSWLVGWLVHKISHSLAAIVFALGGWNPTSLEVWVLRVLQPPCIFFRVLLKCNIFMDILVYFLTFYFVKLSLKSWLPSKYNSKHACANRNWQSRIYFACYVYFILTCFFIWRLHVKAEAQQHVQVINLILII